MRSNTLNILGIRVHPVNIPEALHRIADLIQNHQKGYITVTGVHGIMESQRSDVIKAAHTGSFLTVPDGMPLVYIGRAAGYTEMHRCYGPDLMLALMKESVKKGYTHFFYGGKDGVAESLKETMETRFPGIRIVGTYTPPFRPLNEAEKKDLQERIARLKPNIIWVGLSTPKQELFMYEYLLCLETNLMVGVGAAFDFHTGQIKSAPSWMQKLALEWFYRLLQEPRRLWKRYLINNPLFIWNYTLQLLNLKKFEVKELT
ncbi:MAG: glycosyltransferase [Candidatus Brocadia sp. WS118]|nr:MAG: glycosyltransferase [Candidatus Brocadia sp. WS118]